MTYRTYARAPTGASIARSGVLAGLSLMTLAALTAAAVAAPAAPLAPPAPVKLDEVGSGSLLFKTEREGLYLPAPTVATEIDMRISGMVARVRVRQRFVNPVQSWLEGVYVFPLPDNASVDRMRLIVGDRVIEAKIAEREAARRTYRKAKREGRRAALVEQERPNIFTTSVANIAPGETVSVDIRYHQTLKYDQRRFRLRFPMVVGPRYIPGPATTVTADGSGSGWATTADPVPDADRITPPVRHPDDGAINPVTLKIALDAGFPLAALESPYHKIKTDDWRDGYATIELAQGAVPADRDFELVWTPEVGRAPLAGVFRETVDGETYLLVMVLPPKLTNGEQAIPPRDVVYILDRSGSMGGASIRQAKHALSLALDRLRPVDRFNLIWFSNSTDTLFGTARPADPRIVAHAKTYIGAIEANGGTEMLPALQRALREKAVRGRLRQIVFLTDGAVGNETRLFKEIARNLGKSRLFTVGIGSAPNSYFMRKAAEAGRGTFVHIGKPAEVETRMTGLFRKLEQPVVTDILTAWTGNTGGAVAAYPRVPPDLYDGEPLVLAARLGKLETGPVSGTLTLSGRVHSQQWSRLLDLATARDAAGISALWGRSKIAELMDSVRRGADPAAVREAVIETALRHKLVSKYTSLVAVDATPARPEAATVSSRRVPTNLPHGWDYEKVFGPLLKRAKAPAPPAIPDRDATAPAAPGATPTRFATNTAAPGGAAAQPTPALMARLAQPTTGGTPVTLPQGASPSRLHLLAGGAALAISAGLIVVLVLRRRTCV